MISSGTKQNKTTMKQLTQQIDQSYRETTIVNKNIGTNDKFYRKVAFLMYTEMFNFRPQSRKAAPKPKPHRGLGTRLPSL